MYILISSHVLTELEKIATNYGIIQKGRMIKELSAEELEKECPTYVLIKIKDVSTAKGILARYYNHVVEDEQGNIRIYDVKDPKDAVKILLKENISISEITTNKISLEEYYINLKKETN